MKTPLDDERCFCHERVLSLFACALSLHDIRSGVSRFNSETSRTRRSYIINLFNNKFQEEI